VSGLSCNSGCKCGKSDEHATNETIEMNQPAAVRHIVKLMRLMAYLMIIMIIVATVVIVSIHRRISEVEHKVLKAVENQSFQLQPFESVCQGDEETSEAFSERVQEKVTKLGGFDRKVETITLDDGKIVMIMVRLIKPGPVKD
jgi:cell division FtsZ-interacting protein ZapD